VNKISGHFRIQIFFMFHVNLHVPHRNHIFTSTSGTSRAMQPRVYSKAIGRRQRNTNTGMPCLHFRITVRTHMHHNSTPAAHMATLIHASTHSHALSHCNHSSHIISFINESATGHLKSILRKRGRKTLRNQINKGKTTRSVPHSKAFKRPAHQPRIKSRHQNKSMATPRQAERTNTSKQDGV